MSEFDVPTPVIAEFNLQALQEINDERTLMVVKDPSQPQLLLFVDVSGLTLDVIKEHLEKS